MSNSELYLIRHGESEMNVNRHLIGGRSNETPLTEKGIEQARLLGRYFLENDIIPTKVFVSPAVRTVQTAKETLKTMGMSIEPTVADEIQEMDQGKYVGRLRSEIYTPVILLEIEKQGKDFLLPGGESMNAVGHRMLQWADQNVPVGTDSEAERTFVFGHGLAIRCLASTLQDWSRKETFESITDNTSFTQLLYQDDHWQLHTFGAIPHLDQ